MTHVDVAVIGTGYVGTTTSIAFAAWDHKVIAIDSDREKISKLNRSVLPFYEEGLEKRLEQYRGSGNLSFTDDLKQGIARCDVLFIAVGTPSSPDGSADLSYVEMVARQIGQMMDRYKVVVTKSTVPVGTGDKIKAIITDELKKRNLSFSVDIVSNPEFLREGRALYDALHPERVVIGCETETAKKVMATLYERAQAPILYTTIRDAEMIKYAANAFLATKISFVNELARLCEKTGTNIMKVTEGMGMDSRIGPQFLRAGIGYGGSCFPKDTTALLNLAREQKIVLPILQAASDVNQTQVTWFMKRIQRTMGSFSGKRITLLGLTFKPETDDTREAPSLKIIEQLLQNKAVVNAYDPQGMEHVKKIYPQVVYKLTPYEALKGADAIILATEWREILDLDWSKVKGLVTQPYLFDGRNALDPSAMRDLGYCYVGIGIGERGDY
ncbi:UDPglucose 6-dehydrogenase [Aneurinibacillus migulanus]|uniref:UDP-glucose 6-dehydrogenase n=1 Tax=Aneurinibacillus migulanus TaxID=47500 RepID=A0A1G8YCU2_ANEMI|nr:UDP-glucose 6-dehydrogenase [Aneurinibacillus migulanus]SDK00541.1 UDPglucose 6-dehydrogenase [Aneurinibacillus migulanus]